MFDYRFRQFRSPSIYGNYWFNTEPFSISDLQGRVALIEFWDYASLPSVRSLAYVKDWARKYADHGVVVVGVHTPIFAFGRVQENLEEAIRRLGIEFPVVADNEGLVWTAFGCRAWPSKYVIDKDGFIRFTQSGEGGYDQVERTIQSLLVESGMHGSGLPDLSPPLYATDIPGVVNHKATSEIQAGYLRGALGNPEGFSPEGTLNYQDQGMYLPGRFYLGGAWMCGRESVEHDGSAGEEGTLTVRYEGAGVSAVLAPQQGRPASFQIRQDGNPLTPETCGADVRVDKKGASGVLVDRPGLFHLVTNREFGEFVLTLQTADPGGRIFSLSFLTSPIAEVVHSN